ncbi:MAG: hypothetical protein K2J74_08115, partial [Muribaculaceae bacterium]|nr:hypothetical protein [Muribaculaceae bacterium]
ILMTAAIAVSCTSTKEEEIIGGGGDVLPPVPQTPDSVVSKPKGMWITAYDENYKNFSNKENVIKYLKMCQTTGFNLIYLDAMSGTGYTFGDVPGMKRTNEGGWDWFDCVVECCDSMGLDLIVGVVPLRVGDPRSRQGVVYDSDNWNGKTQCKKVITNKDTGTYEIVDSKDDVTTVGVVLDPTVTEAREYAAKVCVDVAKAYKDHPSFKGISLDYVRWANSDDGGAAYGYGNATMRYFEQLFGFKVENLNDIITATGGVGKYYSEWLYARTKAVTETIKLINQRVKAAVPECEIHLWASADIRSRIGVGQNWASNKCKDSLFQGFNYYQGDASKGLESYAELGFAEYLDVFILGAYADAVWKVENPTSVYSVENFVNTYSDYIPKSNKCKVYGSLGIYAYNKDDKQKKSSDAVKLCLTKTDGLMVFELGHTARLGLWSGIKQGIDYSKH